MEGLYTILYMIMAGIDKAQSSHTNLSTSSSEAVGLGRAAPSTGPALTGCYKLAQVDPSLPLPLPFLSSA